MNTIRYNTAGALKEGSMKRNMLNCRKAALVLCLCIGCCLYASRGLAAEVSEEGSIVEERGGLLYLPAGIETGVVYPLLIAFSSDGDAAWYLDHLMALADEYTWIVFASSGFDEDASMIEVVNPLADLLPVLAEEYPVDLENVFTCGYDEGGSCA